MELNDILNISIDLTSDEEKDRLFDILAWSEFDDEEDIDREGVLSVIKIFQSFMRFKQEQVGALKAEVENLGSKQDKEYGKVDLNNKNINNTSDYEDLEMRYKDLKQRFKSLQKKNENQKEVLEKMKQTIKEFEEEKKEFLKELQKKRTHDDSSSDMSDSSREKHDELRKLIHEKNNQISKLLRDIQETEEENNVLREKVTNLRDNLQEATNHIDSLTTEISSYKLLFDNKTETIETLTKENETLNIRLQNAVEEKQQLETETKEFVEELNSKIDKWKEILKEKDDTIKQLKESQPQSRVSATDSCESEKLVVQLEVLNKCVVEKEENILQLKKQIQIATEEMETTTTILEEITKERNSLTSRVEELIKHMNELKTEKNEAHERCLNLQDQIEYLEETIDGKTEELKKYLNKMKQKGEIELCSVVKENSKLKSSVRFLEKQAKDYLKSSDKLQNVIDNLEVENSVLREKLGLPLDEEILYNGIILKPIKQKKEIRKLQNNLRNLEEEQINLKLKNERLKKTVNKLSSQVSELGGKPLDEEEHLIGIETLVENEKYKEILEENEALRQGLHEIMTCINNQKDSPCLEIKSESLERVLKALDVKHISGWYHPAMRLQAEVHSLKGGNTELRNQLRTTRVELLNLKSKRNSETTEASLKEGLPEVPPGFDEDFLENVSSKTEKLITYLNDTVISLIRECNKKESINVELVEAVNKFKKDFSVINSQMEILYKRYKSEKETWEKEKQTWIELQEPLKEKLSVLEAKLSEYSDSSPSPVSRSVELAGEVAKLNRKCIFFENADISNRNEIYSLKNELKLSENNAKLRVKKLTNEIKQLQTKNDILSTKCSSYIERRKFIEAQKNFEDLTLKQRELQQDLIKFRETHFKELSILSKTVELLNNEKKELQMKLADSIANLSEEEVLKGDKSLKDLSNRVAQLEVNEINERQRANHMTNLYEVVKEQLQKVEERFKDNEKYSKDLVERNYLLQNHIKDLEDKIIGFVSNQVVQDLESRLSKCAKEIEVLMEENKQLVVEVLTLKEVKSDEDEILRKDMEILNLKHQLVDLQASSDDKALLARLSEDVILARMSERECKKKLEEAEHELHETRENFEEYKAVFAEQKRKIEDFDEIFDKKIRFLEDVIIKKREQYLGCIPMESEQKFIEHLRQAVKDKQAAFTSLQNAQKLEKDFLITKKQFSEKLTNFQELEQMLQSDESTVGPKLREWITEKTILVANEIKSNCDLRFKEEQLKQLTQRLSTLENQCLKLEEELFFALQNSNVEIDSPGVIPRDTQGQNDSSSSSGARNSTSSLTEMLKTSKVLKKDEESQTVIEIKEGNDNGHIIDDLHARIHDLEKEINEKNCALTETKSKMVELEMTLSLFRTQMADKHSQITFYEKHIMELQNKLINLSKDLSGSPLDPKKEQEVTFLQDKIEQLEESLRQKEISFTDLQVLLKSDRDEHSLAALRMQQQVQKLQIVIEKQREAYQELLQKNNLKEFVDSEEEKNDIQIREKDLEKNAIENYVSQVHKLEKRTNELYTSLTSLTTQLQASREEVARWKVLANERLDNVDQIRQTLQNQHKEELFTYKQENEKWRNEVIQLQQALNKYRLEFNDLQPDIVNQLREKDDKIQELNATITNLRCESRKNFDRSPKLNEIELRNKQLTKEIEALKKNLEQTMNREKNAKEEARNLKEQLMKRPLCLKSDRSDKEQQLIKKINYMESEMQDLKDKLNDQILQNESHKVLVADDFDKWKRQKLWQQKAEKLQIKLKEKEDELEKIAQTCSSYRILIERLERDKHILENKLKHTHHGGYDTRDLVKMDEMKKENYKLRKELDKMRDKFQMQQHHSGALGATMMQEKLEAQERKIAILELTSKGPSEIRNEIERLQGIVSSLQKANCNLEAENLEQKLDLEKFEREVPQLRERMQYLENYVEVLKEENAKHEVTGSGDQGQEKSSPNKLPELERTIFILKRVVEKLQVENKRLLNKDRACSTKNFPIGYEKLKSDFVKIKEQLTAANKKNEELEKQLEVARNRIQLFENGEELKAVKLELEQKTNLLSKVKVVLCKAASKEKALLQEISLLKYGKATDQIELENKEIENQVEKLSF